MIQTPILQTHNLTKRFGEFLLDDISIELSRGEVHVVVGENGSGKSTLMKLLGGWFPPEKGTILLEGKPVVFSSISQARKNGIIYLNQDIQTFDNLTVAENVFFGELDSIGTSRLLVNRLKMSARCRKLFQELGISIDPDEKLERLGFAERQLIAAVQGYVSRADIIIFDEPSSAMSEPDREILFRIVRALKAENRAIFYISHRMDEIREIGDRVSVIAQGKLTHTQTCENLSHAKLISMMTGDVQKDRYPKLDRGAGTPILEIENLVLQPILKGVSFKLNRGEILGITGLMGSGRTLLANCLFGITKPDQGTISLEGNPVSFASPIDAMKAGISLIPEDRVDNGIFSKQDLVNNSTTAALRRFMKSSMLNDYDMQVITQEYVRLMGIAPGKNADSVITYSGGNQQKVLITRWLMNRSRIYIMDEPTRSIDVASKIDIYNTINDLASKGVSIILISSEIEEILGMCDRVLVLAKGIIACDLARNEATKATILAYATLEKEQANL